ncbi:MAG: hypothetical protein ABIU11_03565 [Chitinophagaceae bacterium]
MADNIKGEHLDNPTNTQVENLSDETTPAKDTENIAQIQETENMEVHHHAHHEGKKNWKSYFWEFLMLFLAVFCGFLAEYQLEHVIENGREKQFIYSLAGDVKKDITQGDSLQIKNQISVKLCDSLLTLLSSKEIIANSNFAYSLWRSVNGFIDFVPNDGTIQQLKNSGALRLIRKKDVVDKLMEYNKVTELIKIHQLAMNSFLFQDTKKSELFDIPNLDNNSERNNIPLLSTDKKTLSGGYSYIKDWKGLLLALNNYVEIAKTKGNDLLQSINKEYHLQSN